VRDDIAVLERVLARLEASMDARWVPEPAPRRAGGRLLTAEDLRAQREALVRRIAAAQRIIDGEDEPQPGAEREPAPDVAPARTPARAPVPRAQPT
jgi:hypothetical protein